MKKQNSRDFVEEKRENYLCIISLCDVPEFKNTQQENKSFKRQTKNVYLALRQRRAVGRYNGREIHFRNIFLSHIYIHYYIFNYFSILFLK